MKSAVTSIRKRASSRSKRVVAGHALGASRAPSTYGLGGQGFRREGAGGMRRSDPVAVALAVKGKAVDVTPELQVVDELAAEDERRHLRHQIGCGMSELPE